MIEFLIALLMIETAAIMFAGWLHEPGYLRSTILVQMILISLFAPKLFEIDTFSSNVGSIFYAAVFTCQCAVARRFSLQAAAQNIWIVVGMMGFFYALLGVLGSMPITFEDADFARAIDQIALTSPVNAFISLVAFMCAQVILIATLTMLPRWHGTVIAVIIAQAVDSVIFYPVVFRNLPLHDMTQIMIDGYITKLVCAVLLIPAYLYCSRKRPNDLVEHVSRRVAEYGKTNVPADARTIDSTRPASAKPH